MSTFKLLGTASMLVLMSAVAPANADAINNLSISVLPDAQVVPPSFSAAVVYTIEAFLAGEEPQEQVRKIR